MKPESDISEYYPCSACGRRFAEHDFEKSDGKCLFGSQKWEPRNFRRVPSEMHKDALVKIQAHQDILTSAINSLNTQIGVLQVGLENAQQLRALIRKACKHVFRGGKSATAKTALGTNRCSICGEDDY